MRVARALRSKAGGGVERTTKTFRRKVGGKHRAVMGYMGIPICRGNARLVYRSRLLHRSNGLVGMGRAVIR